MVLSARYLKIEKVDATEIIDSAIAHKEKKYNDLTAEYKECEKKGNTFITEAQQVKNK